jgi:uncharacterized membrane protein
VPNGYDEDAIGNLTDARSREENDSAMTTGITDTNAGDKRVLVASFDTLGGANLAVEKLHKMEKAGLLDVENTLAISKNAWDKLDVKQAGDVSTGQGAKVGALVGGVVGLIFPPSLLASAALGGAIGAITAKLRGEQLSGDDIKAMAESMSPGTSMLVTVMEPQWADEVEAALVPDAVKISWATMNEAAVKQIADQTG